MNLKIPKVKNILYLGMFLMILKVSLGTSSIFDYSDSLDRILTVGATFCLIIHILSRRFSTRIFIIYAIIATVTLVSAYLTGNYWMLISVITCMAVRGEQLDKIVRFLFSYQTLYFICHFCYAMVCHWMFEEKISAVISGVTRYHFGMGHPNRFSIYFFNLVLMWVWLNFDKIKPNHIGLLALIEAITYYFTKTRTNLFEMYIIFALILIYKIKPLKVGKLITRVTKYVVPIFAVCTMLLVILYTKGNMVAYRLDTLLTGRIKLGAYAYQNYGPSLLGQNMQSVSVKWDATWQLNDFTFDNTYSFLCINQGIVWLIAVAVLFFFVAKRGNVRNNVLIIAWALYGITEVHGLNVYMCFPIILVSLLFCNKYRISDYGLEK